MNIYNINDERSHIFSRPIKLSCILCATALNCSFAMKTDTPLTANIDVIEIAPYSAGKIMNDIENVVHLDQCHLITKETSTRRKKLSAKSKKRNLSIDDITMEFFQKIEEGAFEGCKVSDCILSPNNFLRLKKELPSFLGEIKNKGICFREKSLIPSEFGTFQDGVLTLTLDSSDWAGLVVFLLNTAIDNPEEVMEIVCKGPFSGLYLDKGYKNVKKVTLPALEEQQLNPYSFDFCYYSAPEEVSNAQVLNLDSLDNLLKDARVLEETKTFILKEKDRRGKK